MDRFVFALLTVAAPEKIFRSPRNTLVLEMSISECGLDGGVNVVNALDLVEPDFAQRDVLARGRRPEVFFG